MKLNSAQPTIGREALRLSISKVVTLSISLVTTMFLSRFRTLDEYGTYSQLLLVINLSVCIIMLGLPNSINYFLARAETQEEQRKFLSVFYTINTLLSVLTGLILVLAIPFIELYFKNPSIKYYAFFLALYPWANVTYSSLSNVLVVYNKTKAIVWINLLYSALTLAVILLIQLLNFGFNEYLIAYLCLNVLFAVLTYIFSASLCGGLKISFNKELIKSILYFSIPLGLAAVVGTLDIEIDKLLIGRLMTTEDLAIYTNASKELPVTFIASSITAVLLPQMAIRFKNNDDEGAVKLWGYATELSFIFIAFIVAGCFCYAEEAMEILYSKKYLAGVSVFRVYTLVLLLRCTYFGIVLSSKGRTKQIFVCSVISLILNAILNPLFYIWLGIIGPAIATFISILIVLIGQLIMSSKCTEIPFNNILPWKELGKISIVNIAFLVLFYFIKKILPLEVLLSNIAESILLGVVWSVCYLFVLRKKIKKVWIMLNE